MLETLISSKTRLKLLLKFFLNSRSKSYLRNLETEFGESTNAIRLELNKFEEAGMLTSSMDGNKKMYRANTQHPLYNDVHNIVMKYVGLDRITEHVVGKIGDLESVHLVGDYARGVDTGIIDLVFIGSDIDRNYLSRISAKAEKIIDRKIRYLVYSGDGEMKEGYNKLSSKESLTLWKEKSV